MYNSRQEEKERQETSWAATEKQITRRTTRIPRWRCFRIDQSRRSNIFTPGHLSATDPAAKEPDIDIEPDSQRPECTDRGVLREAVHGSVITQPEGASVGRHAGVITA